MFKLLALSCVLACSSAQILAGYGLPLAYTGGIVTPWDGNYRGPLSLAPGQPANVLGADGRPLDTLDVNLDKSAHITAKAFEGAGVHLLKKRSVAFAAPYTRLALPAAPLAYSAPLTTYSHGHIATSYAGPITSYTGHLVHY